MQKGGGIKKLERGEMRWRGKERQKETRGGTDWGGEGSACFSSPVFCWKGGARERGRKDFGEGQRWRCAYWPRSGPLFLFKSSCFRSACCHELEMTSSATPSCPPPLRLSPLFSFCFYILSRSFCVFFSFRCCFYPTSVVPNVLIFLSTPLES